MESQAMESQAMESQAMESQAMESQAMESQAMALLGPGHGEQPRRAAPAAEQSTRASPIQRPTIAPRGAASPCRMSGAGGVGGWGVLIGQERRVYECWKGLHLLHHRLVALAPVLADQQTRDLVPRLRHLFSQQ